MMHQSAVSTPSGSKTLEGLLAIGPACHCPWEMGLSPRGSPGFCTGRGSPGSFTSSRISCGTGHRTEGVYGLVCRRINFEEENGHGCEGTLLCFLLS